MKPERLIVVSNRLPVRVQHGEEGFIYTPSVGGLATTLNALRGDLEMLWLGTPGINARDPQEFEAIRQALAREFGSVPVALEASQFKRYYASITFLNSRIMNMRSGPPIRKSTANSAMRCWKSCVRGIASGCTTII